MQDTISVGTKNSEENNRFPGIAAYVETFDTDEDIAESADILSFESLREAFAALRVSETELAKTIPEIELSENNAPTITEQPDYADEGESVHSEVFENPLPQNIESSMTIGTRLETIIESMLFVGNRENRPLRTDQITENLRNVSAGDVEQAVAKLNENYRERNCPYTIIAEHCGYRMVLYSEFEFVRSNFYGKIRGVKLSQQAVDTLAVVAYRQPITAEEIQTIRNQSCSAILNQLVRRNLLKISRETHNKNTVVYYHTTSRFLALFQIKSLDDIPRAEELGV